MRRLLHLALVALLAVVPAFGPASATPRWIKAATNPYAPAWQTDLTAGTLPTGLNFSSAGAGDPLGGLYQDVDGTYRYRPSNINPNSVLAGGTAGVIGSGGVLPSGMGVVANGNFAITNNGLTTIGGVPYLSLTVAGTANGTTFRLGLQNAPAAPSGAYVMSSIYVGLTAGALPAQLNFVLVERFSGAFLINDHVTDNLTLTGTPARFYGRNQLTQPTANQFTNELAFVPTNGQVVSFTLLIGGLQNEIVTAAQTAPSALIQTTGTAYYGPRFPSDSNLSSYSAGNRLANTTTWSNGAGSTVALSAMTGPDGSTVNAYKVMEDSSNGEHYIDRSVLNSIGVAGTWVDSIYVKVAERNTFSVRPVHVGEPLYGTSPIFFDTTANSGAGGNTATPVYRATNAGIKAVGNGWYRVWVTYTTTAASASRAHRIQLTNVYGNGAYTGTTGSGVYVYAPQTSLITTAQAAQIAAANDPGAFVPNTTGSAAGYPETLSTLGLLVEGGTTNGVRNNTMQGAVVGDTELVSNTLNPLFGTGISGWTAGSFGGGSTAGVTAHTGGGFDIIGTGSGSTGAYTPISVVAGQSYVICATVASTGLNVGINSTTTVGGLDTVAMTALTGSNCAQWTAASTTTTYVQAWKTSSSTSTLTNVSVRRTYVTNGDFAANPTTGTNGSSTPVNGWAWLANGSSTVTYSGGVVTIVGDGTNSGAITTSISVTNGVTYTLLADVGTTAINAVVSTAAFSGGTAIATLSMTSLGTTSIGQFTATSTGTYWITFARSSAFTTTIDNVRIRSAGVLPTNHSIVLTAGLAYEVTELVNDSGLPATGLRLFGTTTASGSTQIPMEANGTIAAVSGDTWVNSVSFRQTGGTQTGILQIKGRIVEQTSGLTTAATNDATNTLSLSTSLTRYSQVQTLGGTGTAWIRPYFIIVPTGTGVAIDLSFRVMGAQTEKQPAATSVVPTYGSTITTNPDTVTFTGAPLAMLQAAQGTAIVEAQTPSVPTQNTRLIGTNNASFATLLYIPAATNTAVGTWNGTSGVFTDLVSGTWTGGARAVVAWSPSGRSVIGSGGTAVTDSNLVTGAFSAAYLGSDHGTSAFLNGYFCKVALYPTRLPNAIGKTKSGVGVPFAANDNVPEWLRRSFAMNE